MSDERPPASGDFIQFGDGPKLPISGCSWMMSQPAPAPDYERLPLLREFSVEIPIPSAVAAAVLRAIGAPAAADRVDIAAHPDLAELNLQADGFYDMPATPAPPTRRSTE